MICENDGCRNKATVQISGYATGPGPWTAELCNKCMKEIGQQIIAQGGHLSIKSIETRDGADKPDLSPPPTP